MHCRVNWFKYLEDLDACGTCLFGNYLAVVGGSVDRQSSVVLLDRSTGEVMRRWVGERGLLSNYLSVGDVLYAVGENNQIYAFDTELRVLNMFKGPHHSQRSL